MKQFRLFGILTFFLFFVTCGHLKSKEDSSNYPSNWKSIEASNFSIHFPDSIIVDKSGQMGMTFDLLTKRTSPQDMFSENINLVTEDLKGNNVTLDRYVNYSKGQIKLFITNSKILLSERVKNNDLEYHTIIFTGDQGIYKLKFEQRYRIKNGIAFVLTFSSETNQFEKYKDMGEKIMNSFRLK